MAHTYDNKYQAAAGAGNPYVFATPYTCGVGTTLFVLSIVVGGTVARAGGPPTYNGVALLQADQNRQSTETFAELWYMLNPPTGAAYEVSIPNTGAKTLAPVASSYKAASGYTSALRIANGGTGTSTNPTGPTLTTLTTGDVIVAVVGTGAQTWAPTGRTGVLLYDRDVSTWGDGEQYLIKVDANDVAMAWTFGTSDDWAICEAAFKEVAQATPIIITDSGSGSDTPLCGKTLKMTDSGSGGDGPKAGKGLIMAQTGSGVDSILAGKGLKIADAGAGVDSVSKSVALLITDTGAGVDVALRGKIIALADTVSGVDLSLVGKPVVVTDVGVGADVILKGKIINLADSGVGADALLLGKAVKLLDTGSGADGVIKGRIIFVADTGAGADLVLTGKTLKFADIGVATDAALTGKSFKFADIGVGADAVLRGRGILVIEVGGGVDQALAGKTILIIESGAGQEVVTVEKQAGEETHVIVSDSATALDLILLVKGLKIYDFGQADDIVMLGKAFPISDNGYGSDNIKVMNVMPEPPTGEPEHKRSRPYIPKMSTTGDETWLLNLKHNLWKSRHG